jgi:hypothetical protein
MLPLRLKAKGRSFGLTICKASFSDGGLSLGGVATSTTRVCVGVNILSELVASMSLIDTT